MSVPTLQYANNEVAAQAVYRYIRMLVPPLRHLRLRPSDSSALATTTWWLITGAGAPIHARGKLYLRREPGMLSAHDPGLLSAGFCVERGLGRQLAGLEMGGEAAPDLVDPDLMLQPSWFWYRFLNDALGGLFGAPMLDVLERSGQPISINVDLHRFDGVAPQGPGTADAYDHVAFTILDDTLVLHPTRTTLGELAVLNDAIDLRDLVLRVESIRDLTWYWVTFWIGIQARYGDDQGNWSARELWLNALEPWLPWVH